MAQNFVGANNINLLEPSGQFGTRLQGGKDSASERYIFTRLSKITRSLFPEQDDAILKYLNDDGYPVEPIFYVPILPLILINGSKGIGTGFSTDIMCYNPLDIISYIKNKLNNIENTNTNSTFIPYYEGFTGTILKISDTKFLFKGIYQQIAPDKIRVTELPVGYWTQDFKEHLESLQDPVDKDGKKLPPIIKDYDDMSKDTTIDFTITFQKGKLEEFINAKGDYECNGLEKLLKLYSTNSTTNMNLFNAEDKLMKYSSVSDIIDDYFTTRLKYYLVRKDYLIQHLEKQLVILSNKARYIQEVLEGTVDLRKKKKHEITELLENKQYAIIDNDAEYKYLVKMAMDSVSEENVEKMCKECKEKEVELTIVRDTSIQKMWMNELEQLETVYQEYVLERRRLLQDEPIKKTAKKIIKKTKHLHAPVEFLEVV